MSIIKMKSACYPFKYLRIYIDIKLFGVFWHFSNNACRSFNNERYYSNKQNNYYKIKNIKISL